MRALLALLLMTASASANCIPLLPFELKVAELLERRPKSQKYVMYGDDAQHLIEQLTSVGELPDLPHVDRVILISDGPRTLVLPLQRLLPTEDLISCYWVVVDTAMITGPEI